MRKSWDYWLVYQYSAEHDMEIKKIPERIENISSISGSLPLLDYVNEIYSIDCSLPFRGYKILAVQHLLGASIPFFNMFEKGGVNPKDIYIVGKAYSSYPGIVQYLQKRGYNLTFEEVFHHVPDQPYDSVLTKQIIHIVTNLLKKANNNQKWLIIDDGAKAIELLHLKFPKLAKQFTCVELTSRGARTVNTLQLLCPVINVARSGAKTLYEAPMIAKSMVEEFISSLALWEKAGVYRLLNKRVLLLGYGFIGENVAKKLLRYGFDVSVYDKDENMLAKAQNAGLVPVRNLHKIYQEISVLMGCSGTPVIPESDFRRLKAGTLLVNMASTDTEFSAWKLRSQGEIIHQKVLPCDLKFLKKYMPLSWRSLYKVKQEGTYLYLANGGFPVNFSGKMNPVPIEDIQLTSSLLMGGAIQAVKAKESQLIDLDSDLQEKVVQKYLNLSQNKKEI